MRRRVICCSNCWICSGVMRSMWFQKLWEDSQAASAGSKRVRAVCRYQSANWSLLAGGGDGAIDGGEQEVLTAGESLVALEGENGIEQRDEIETLGDVPECGDVAEGGNIAMEGLGRRAGMS